MPSAVPDLAQANAPTQMLELIGDPRSGVVDDVTRNSFGGLTVDMVHHQPSNEVYWFKYEMSGGLVKGGHRDGRLSEYSKNLMYLLRAKDPVRWTIDALAIKFRIRKQRVMAILALKEMEAHGMEKGELLPGPLSAYACPVRLSDVPVNDVSGEFIGLELDGAVSVGLREIDDRAQNQAGNAPPPGSVLQGAGVGAGEDGSVLPLHNSLPRLTLMAQHVQQQLVASMKSCGYDLGALRSEVLTALDAAEAALAALRPAQPEGKEQEEGDEAKQAPASPLDKAIAAVAEQKARAGALLDALDALLLQQAAPAPAEGGDAAASEAAGEEGKAASTSSAASRRPFASSMLEEEAIVVAASKALTAALQPAVKPEALQAALAGLEGDRLLRIILALPLPLRTALLNASQPTCVTLNAMGVDLSAVKSKVNYALPGGQSKDLPAVNMAVDALGWAYISPQQYSVLQQALKDLEQAGQNAQACMDQLAGTAPVPQSDKQEAEVTSGSALLASLANVSTTYRSALGAVKRLEGDLYAAEGGEGDSSSAPASSGSLMDGPEVTEDGARRAILTLIAEAGGPAALEGVELREALEQLQRAGDAETAAAVRTKLRALSGLPPAPITDGDDAPVPGSTAAENAARELAGKYGKGSFDVLAAWLDAVPGGRVFHRGSGERNIARLATYPAFEGYPVAALDQLAESELSSLNRQIAERQEETLFKGFKESLLFNLGLVGEKVWDPSQARPAGNKDSVVEHAPMVVYNITKNGKTMYPPACVVENDGTKRPLNEQERVWQLRRKQQKPLPYMMTRTKRKPELA